MKIRFGFGPERTTQIKMSRYLGRVGGPRGADKEKSEEKKEESSQVSFEEFFNSFGLKKTGNEVEEENDESSANTRTGLGKENGDNKKKTNGGVETGREFFFTSVIKKEG